MAALSPESSLAEKSQALRALTAFERMGGGLVGPPSEFPGVPVVNHLSAIFLQCLINAAATEEAAAAGAAATGEPLGLSAADAREQQRLTERALLFIHAFVRRGGGGGAPGFIVDNYWTGPQTGIPAVALALRALAQRAPPEAYQLGAEGMVALLAQPRTDLHPPTWYPGLGPWVHSGLVGPSACITMARLGRMALLPEADWELAAGHGVEPGPATAADVDGTLCFMRLLLDREDAFPAAALPGLCRILAWAVLDAASDHWPPPFIATLRGSGLLARMTALWLRHHQAPILLGLAAHEPSLPGFFADVLLRRIVPTAAAAADGSASRAAATGFGRALTGVYNAQVTQLQQAFPERDMWRSDVEAGQRALLAALLAPERAADLWSALAQDCGRVGAVTLLDVLKEGGERGLLGAMRAEDKALIGRQIDALKVASQRPRLWASVLRPHFFGSPQEHLADVLARLEPAISFTAGGKLKGVRMALIEELVVALAGLEEEMQQQQLDSEAGSGDFPLALAAKVEAVLGAMGREEAAARLDKVLEGCKLARHAINLAGTRSKQRWASPRLRLLAAAFAALARGPAAFVALLSVDEAAERAWKEEALQQRAKKAAAAKRKSGGGGDAAAAAAAAALGQNRHDPLYIPRSSAIAAFLSIKGQGPSQQQQHPPAASPSPCLLEHWVEALCGTKEAWLHLALARACRHPTGGQAVLQALVNLQALIPQTNMGRLAKGLAMLLGPSPGPLTPLTPEEEREEEEEGDGEDGEEVEDEEAEAEAEPAAAMDVDKGAAGGDGASSSRRRKEEEGAVVSPAALLSCLTAPRDGGSGVLEFRLEDRVPALVMALYRHPSPGARRLFAASALMPDAPARLVRMLVRLQTGGGGGGAGAGEEPTAHAQAAAAAGSSSSTNSFATRSLADVLGAGGEAAVAELTALATPEQLLDWRAWNAVRLLAEARPEFVLPAVLDAAAAGAPGLGSIVADALRSFPAFARACVEGHLPALLAFLAAVSAGKGRAALGLTALDLIASAAGAVPDFAPRVRALVEAEKETDEEAAAEAGDDDAGLSTTASLRRLVEALSGDRRVLRDAAHRLLVEEIGGILPHGSSFHPGPRGAGAGDDGHEGASAAAGGGSGRAARARKRQRS